MTRWRLFGGPFDGEDVEVPAGKPPMLPPRVLGRVMAASSEEMHAAAERALQQGATADEARAKAIAASFTYEPEAATAVNGRFIFTRAGKARTDQQEDA